jgi:hypothetical protein
MVIIFPLTGRNELLERFDEFDRGSQVPENLQEPGPVDWFRSLDMLR